MSERERLFHCCRCVPTRLVGCLKTKKEEGTQTHRDPVILVRDLHVVSLPGDGGFRVAPRGDALHDGRLPCRHHHVAGRLTEVVPQNCQKKKKHEKSDGALSTKYVEQKTSARSHQSASARLPFNIITCSSYQIMHPRGPLTLYFDLTFKKKT